MNILQYCHYCEEHGHLSDHCQKRLRISVYTTSTDKTLPSPLPAPASAHPYTDAHAVPWADLCDQGHGDSPYVLATDCAKLEEALRHSFDVLERAKRGLEMAIKHQRTGWYEDGILSEVIEALTAARAITEAK